MGEQPDDEVWLFAVGEWSDARCERSAEGEDPRRCSLRTRNRRDPAPLSRKSFSQPAGARVPVTIPVTHEAAMLRSLSLALPGAPSPSEAWCDTRFFPRLC